MQSGPTLTLEICVLAAAATIREAFYFGHDGREILCLPRTWIDDTRVSPGQRYRVTGRWSALFSKCFEADGIEAL